MNMQWKPSSALSQQWIHLDVHRRQGTTTLEVLFAIAVVMIGLVGIASLIPYANRQAAESYVTTKAATATQNLFHEVQARRLTAPSDAYPWMIAEDQPLTGTSLVPPFGNRANLAQRFISFNRLSDLIAHQSDVLAWGTGATVLPPEEETLQRVSFCYDPLFWAHQPTPMVGSAQGVPLVTADAPYRRTRFPYYMNDYNPLTRLNSPGTWEIQPRMIRITSPAAPGLSRYIEDLYVSSPSTANTAIPVRPAAARRLMSMSDDLVSVVSSNDRSLPGARLFRYSSTDVLTMSRGIPASAGDLVQASTTGEFSWMITYSPVESTNNKSKTYRMSIVFFNKRDQSFLATGAGATVASDFPTAEKVAWAVPTDLATHPVMSTSNPALATESSYDGDRGITVDLYGSTAIDPYGANVVGYKVRAGDWVMLSRQFAGSNVHRWYRVAGVSASPTVIPAGSYSHPHFGSSDPFGTAVSVPITAATVRLVGFDWIFSKRQGSGVSADPTTATIVPNVVGVYERIIEIPLE